MTLWPEARHEILNETNRDEVEIEIVDWLDAHLAPARGLTQAGAALSSDVTAPRQRAVPWTPAGPRLRRAGAA